MAFTRRNFLRHSLCATVGATAGASTLWDLRKVAAAAASQNGDYKALVCIFLYGGNDGNNTLVPRDQTTYNQYAAARGNLALSRAALLPITPLTSDGHDYGLHPNLTGVQQLFNQRKLAFVANVGPLVAPINRQQYLAQSVPMPTQLFSHVDQTAHWMTSLPDQLARTGWGGRIADLVNSLNTNPAVSMSISVSGANTFEVGETITSYQVSPDGTLGLLDYTEGGDAVSQAIRSLLEQSHSNLFEASFSDKTKRAIDGERNLRAVLGGQSPLDTAFPTTPLGKQMKMIANLIKAREALGLRRQIFFCQSASYDTHAAQLGTHASLLSELSGAMAAFYSATVELGVASQVTTFTASDFGRTMRSNGQGSDHGWGNHHMVMGGAVRGGDIIGVYQNIAIDGPDDTGLGRWIPTISTDEYGATLAQWFGVSAGDLPMVFPNLGRFARTNLGFVA